MTATLTSCFCRAWLEAPIKKILPALIPGPELPAVVAERLIQRVLPEELYLSLAATGQFSCMIRDHKFTFKRNAKTLFERDGKIYSCCIDVEDSSRPDQDRIVAEYLLALNDEAKYLEIANLTDVTPSKNAETGLTMRFLRNFDQRDDGWFRRNFLGDFDTPYARMREAHERELNLRVQMEALRLDPRPAYISYDPADGIPIMSPMPTYREGLNELHISQIASECMRQLLLESPFNQTRRFCALSIQSLQNRWPIRTKIDEEI